MNARMVSHLVPPRHEEVDSRNTAYALASPNAVPPVGLEPTLGGF